MAQSRIKVIGNTLKKLRLKIDVIDVILLSLTLNIFIIIINHLFRFSTSILYGSLSTIKV